MAGLRRGWAGLVGVAAVLGAVLGSPAMAAAEPPFRVPTQITDRVGALSGGDQADVQAALDKLAAEDNDVSVIDMSPELIQALADLDGS